jgi:hypothetical protein
MRDIRVLNMTNGQQLESDEVMKRIGQLEYRNLSSFSKVALFNEGKALITNGLRVVADSGMTVKVPTGTIIQREFDVSGFEPNMVGVCIQNVDQTVTLDAADGVARTDIVEGQIISLTDKSDYSRIGAVATGGAGAGSVVITNESIERDIAYSLSVRKQKGTTTPTTATKATLTGLVAIPGTIDLSLKYLIRLEDGEDGDWIEIDCRGATPAATTRAEIIAAINSSVGRTMAADGAGNVIELTGETFGESSYFSIKPPVTDSTADAFEEIFGYTIAGLYRYEYRGTNSWIKLAEIDVGAATVTITDTLIRNLDEKHTWASDANNIILTNPIFDDPLKVDSVSKRTLKKGGVVFNDGIQVNWIRATQVGNDLNISGVGSPALAALNGIDIAFIDTGNDDLRTYRFNGTIWAQVGNDLNISTMGFPALAALNGTDIAFIDSTNDDLRTYRFDGTDWAQVGNDLNISTVGPPALAALNGTDIAFIDSTNDDLRTYRFDGTDWAQVGNDLNISTVGPPALAALNGTDVAFIDGTNEDLRTYRFDGTDWAQVGNDLNISLSGGSPALAALNGTDIAFIDDANVNLRIYRFDGTDWAQVGNDLNISGAGGGVPLAALNGTDIAFIDGTNEDLRTYRFSYFISGYPHSAINPNWV